MVTVIGELIALKFEMSYREDKLPNIFNSESFTKRAKPGMDWKFSPLYLIGMTVHLKTLAWLCNFPPFSLQQICISCLDQAFERWSENCPAFTSFIPRSNFGPAAYFSGPQFHHLLQLVNLTKPRTNKAGLELNLTHPITTTYDCLMMMDSSVRLDWSKCLALLFCSNWRQQYHLISRDSHMTGYTLF